MSQKTENKFYAIHAVPTPGSMMWMWVSKEVGRPFTTMKNNIRRYKTYSAASKAMEDLRANSSAWKNVGNACEVYHIV